MDNDAADQSHAHTGVDTEASGTVSDHTNMYDPEADADIVTTELLEHLATLDSKGELVFTRANATDPDRAFDIHYYVLVRAEGSHGVVNFHLDHPKYHKHPSFTSTILDAYSKRDYRTILSWRPEHAPTLPSSSPRNETFLGNTQSEVKKTVMAMQYSVPYKGQAARVFSEFVQTQAQREKLLYAKVIPVIQSSGTGKSRMLTETGKTLFTLPFSAREKDGTGWPPADNSILAYLLTSPNDSFSIRTHIIFIAFLAAIFAEMKDVLESFGTSCIDTLRQKWYTHMEYALGAMTIPTRNAFYANVLERTKDIESKIRSWNSKLPPLPYYVEVNVHSRPQFFLQLGRRVQHISREFLKAEVIALLTVIPNEVLLVYMDEAYTFRERYWALQRVLWTLNNHEMLWFSFLGTNHDALSEFIPAPVNIHSARLAEELMVLLPPYLDLSFDQNTIDPPLHQTVTMGQVHSLDWICAFGRPLWKASCIVPAGYSVDKTAFFRNAEMKLLCSTTGFKGNIEQVFAILAYTVCLDLVLSNQTAVQLANTSVVKHMHLLVGFNDDQTVCFIHAPSEPVLALVGASIAAKPKYLPDIIGGLTHNLCEAGLVNKGRHGELLARMILFLARVQTCSPPSTPLLFATPVPVVRFLKTLFGEMWNRTPGHKRFEKDFEGGYVNFYHFTLTQDAMPAEEDLNFEANLWTRGTAVQSKLDVGGHIPVYWGPIDEGAVLDPSNFSSLDYRVKLDTAGDTVLADKIQRPASNPDSVKRSNHPFIAVFLNMGCEDDYTSTGSRLWLETGAETLERLKTLNTTELSPLRRRIAKKAIEALELDPNRYCINARGCDEHVFDVLNTMGIAEKWKELVEITVEVPTLDRETDATFESP